jgi:hypothetical protein
MKAELIAMIIIVSVGSFWLGYLCGFYAAVPH